MTKRNFVEEIKELSRLLSKKRKYPPYDNFLDRYNAAFAVLDIVLKSSNDSTHRNEARKNFVVNLVTLTEAYCKEIILRRKGKWDKDGLKKLLDDKDKISLNEVFDLLKIGLSREQLVIKYYSFQSFESINKVFSLLTGEVSGTKCMFFKNLTKMPLTTEKNLATTIDSRIPEWSRHFVRLFEIRHEIIHEATRKPIKKSDMLSMDDTLDVFLWACYLRFEHDE